MCGTLVVIGSNIEGMAPASMSLQRRPPSRGRDVLQLDAGLAGSSLAIRCVFERLPELPKAIWSGLAWRGDIVGEGLVGRFGRHDQDVGRMADQGHVGEVGDDVVRQLG